MTLRELDAPTMELNHHEFWKLFKELVFVVWTTAPEERIGIVEPILEDKYGETNKDTYVRIENHVLRTVAWLERFKDENSEQ